MDIFEEYLQQGEPNKREKVNAWNTAIGLQEVDGIKPSDYLIQTAKQNIEGNISIEEAKQQINNYYQQQNSKNEENRTEEADKVSVRIAEILGENTFSFSPIEYMSIHRRLFEGILSTRGKNPYLQHYQSRMGVKWRNRDLCKCRKFKTNFGL
ncbi:hypothetical protein CCAN11_2050002 [Capnocytophaga canimorsus]|uniref:protein adenylyltransferase n=1 Tax=Capnocytophaga canimorsus TaxID=28188 RepID=A0A0B7IDW7_9FLAO|nr:antitoxin VbhA family protein [Capnocytophaga canimorsus]CEN49960.1 hypothetical protein CCAN11_2050002 [Capnocytophaga canimorsus]